jgi:hypothetical protein
MSGNVYCKSESACGVTVDKSFTQKTYSGTVTLIDIQAPTTIELADPDAPLVWHSTKQELALDGERLMRLRQLWVVLVISVDVH